MELSVHRISLDQTKVVNDIVWDYLNEEKKLAPFYKFPPRFESFSDAIPEIASSFDEERRKVLVEVLNEQYRSVSAAKEVEENITALKKDTTFTVTTGHQPVIFGGPLFFIYKIVSVINTVERLNNQYDNYHFVPVYWMGSEDHDFKEINHTYLFNKAVEWNPSTAKGAVGRMSTASFNEPLDKMNEILGESERAKELKELFENAYLENDNLADATRYLVNALFQEEGVVVIDPDDSRLKQQFVPVMEKELLNQKSTPLVEETTCSLEQTYKNGHFEPQAYPRPINLFYLKDERDRLINQNGAIGLEDSDTTFSKEEIKRELKQHPERFSPNVILRPVYQQVILPNIGYIGGGAEVSYWLELKKVFDHYKVPCAVVG